MLVLLLVGCARSPDVLLSDALSAGVTLEDAAALPFATEPLSERQADAVAALVMEAHLEALRAERQAEWDDEALVYESYTMPLWWTTYGDAPDGERAAWISMHGGGGTTAQVNDQQWVNQQQLYSPDEGVYVAPRAPTNEWNLWHRPEIDVLFDRLVEDLVALEGVDPDRVYLTGYSAGGDGAYQLAWHLADRFAAANPNAGHPNDSNPLSMRNLPVTIHVGGADTAYDRNTVAAEWGEQLDALEADDPGGYTHEVVVHPGLPHWMNGEEAVAIPWMAQFSRRRAPDRVVWQVRGERSGDRFYWLGLEDPGAHSGTVLVAHVVDNVVTVTSDAPVTGLRIWLDDALVDLDRPVTVVVNEETVFEDRVDRTIAAAVESLLSDGAPFVPRRAVIDL